MRRSLVPSLHALIAVESVARHGGIMRAAHELHLSQSAVSRLVKQVEDAIQVKLFDRVRQRLILTEAGRVYSRDTRKILGEFEQATLQVMAYGSGGRSGALNLGVFSTFGTKWLIPRLEQYREKQPNVVISCYARPRQFSFDDDPLDAAIHYGDPIWPGAIVEPLFGEELIPVASPRLPGIKQLKKAKDALEFPLLHEVTRPWAWNRWLEQQGVLLEHSLPGARFDQFNMVVEAAMACLGIALVPRFLFEAEIAAKKLFLPFKQSVLGNYKYYFALPHRNAGNAVLLNFKEWLLETAHSEHLPTDVSQVRP